MNKKKMRNEKREIDLLGRGITLGIIGGIAANFFVSYVFLTGKYLAEKFPKIAGFYFNPVFGLLISLALLYFIFRIFSCGIKNFEKTYKMKEGDKDKTMNRCIFFWK
jgi:H+/Cl- antiporter ClcA